RRTARVRRERPLRRGHPHRGRAGTRCLMSSREETVQGYAEQIRRVVPHPPNQTPMPAREVQRKTRLKPNQVSAGWQYWKLHNDGLPLYCSPLGYMVTDEPLEETETLVWQYRYMRTRWQTIWYGTQRPRLLRRGDTATLRIMELEFNKMLELLDILIA